MSQDEQPEERRRPAKTSARAIKLQERRATVMRMRREGKSIETIAAELGSYPQLIFHDVVVSLEKIAEARMVDTEAYRKRAIARQMFLWQEAYEGWMRSIKDRVQTIEEIKDATIGDDGKPVMEEKLRTLREGQAGDPRFLHEMQECEDRMNRLMGVDKLPPVTNQTTVQFNVVTIPEALAKADDDDLLRIATTEPCAAETSLIDVSETSGGGDAPAA